MYRAEREDDMFTEVPDAAEARAKHATCDMIWLDALSPSPDELVDTARLLDIDDVVIEDALNEGLFPRLEVLPGSILLALHTLVRGEDHIETAPLVCVIGSDYLVTFRHEPSAEVEFLWDAAQRRPAAAAGGPDRMLARLADLVAERFVPLTTELEEAIDRLDDQALDSDPSVLVESQALRRDVAQLRRVLRPQRHVLFSSTDAESPLLGDTARRRLTDAYHRHVLLGESLDAARSMLSSVVDTYRGAVAERTNDAMRVLTVFSATLLPMSVLAGIYGMNFVNVPELTVTWAYFAVLAGMATIGVSLWIYFVYRGFIGRPRLSDVSRSVGRGLGAAATAPVRGVGFLTMAAARRRRGRDDS